MDLPHPSSLSRNYSGSTFFLTPEPLVRALLNGCHSLILKYFPNHGSLFNHHITFLDPAAGLLAFPLELKKFAQETLDAINYQKWKDNILFSKLFACEVDPNLFQQASQIWANEIQSNPEHFFNINTLAESSLPNTTFNHGINYLHNNIPSDSTDLMLIMGNPPYAISTLTKNNWISQLIEDYKPGLSSAHSKRISGLKGIQDDYIKFIRFGQWKLADQQHPGILAYVVNSYFLDGIIFRGMRESLMHAFDSIWIINLHGDPKKRDQSTTHDENVFDIQTGICLFYAIKQFNEKPKSCKIYYSEIKGTKMTKFEFLKQKFDNIPFIQVKDRPNFEFIPLSESSKSLEFMYMKFPYFPDIFLKHVVGVRSLHDTLITHPDRTRLEQIITSFFNGTFKQAEFLDAKNQMWYDNEGVSYHDARDWSIVETRKNSDLSKVLSRIMQWSWRGMDKWWVVYDPEMMTKGCSSFSLMQYLLPSQLNRAIGVARVSRKARGDTSVWITDTIAESHFIEGGSGIGDYIFPLKINYSIQKDDWNHPKSASDSNISPNFKSSLFYGTDLTDEDIFYYCYGILWSPTYRNLYHELLKQDFPRIPFTENFNHFKLIAEKGKNLADLHLNPPFLEKINDIEKYPHNSLENLYIKKPGYVEQTQRIYFDITDPTNSIWIGGITKEMWSFEIGGQPQLALWLENRKYSLSKKKKYAFQRACTHEEIKNLIEICYRIENTIRIQLELDLLYKNAFNNNKSI